MTPENYIEALKEIADHLDKEEKIKQLVLEVEAYEKIHFPIELPSMRGALKFRIDQNHMHKAELFALFGKERTREMLYEKIELTAKEIRLLNEVIGIPLKVLIQKK